MTNLDTDFWKFPLPRIEREKKCLSRDIIFQVYYQGSGASLQSIASRLSGGLLVCTAGVHCRCALLVCTAGVHCWHALPLAYQEACWCALLVCTAGVFWYS